VRVDGYRRSMYSSIVVGTDGSPTAEIALGKAIELARLAGAKLHIVSAYAPAHAKVTGGAPAGEGFAAAPDYKADAALQRALSRLGGEGLEVEEHSPKGDPAEALVTVAGETDADLIVIGSVGMRGARRLLGSVPNKVAHTSGCDVLIVHTD
jgi:nucleotide-binding universal stress UspA family protein